MSTNIDWSKIKKGFYGFEELAIEYVQEYYGLSWKHTGTTRDGNKDAYTIILGYRPFAATNEEWWMEAKYSQTTEYVTRYRLDPTLVSAILKGNVSKIVFVTNILINSKTISDIRQALALSIGCKDVDFCTQNTLEYWLCQNPLIYKKYFADDELVNFNHPNLALIEPMDFFASDLNCISFNESLRILEINHRYCAHLSIYSKESINARLKCAPNLKGIKILSPHNIFLQKGMNYISFDFILKENYAYRSTKLQKEHKMLPIPAFKLDDIDIYSKYSIEVNEHYDKYYKLISQNDAYNFIYKYYKKSFPQTIYLYGLSGVGKSSIIADFLYKIKNTSVLSFFAEMTEDMHTNIIIILKLICFIYFPYLPFEEINSEYLKKLNKNKYIPEFIVNLFSEKENSAIYSLLFKYINEDLLLFPIKLNINKRIIIIDDIHKTDSLIYGVLCKMALEINKRNLPVLFIFSGQEIVRNRNYEMLNKNCAIHEKELSISFNDCLNVLEENNIDTSIIRKVNLDSLFSNTLELLFFYEYIIDNKPVLKDFLSVNIACHLFFKEEILESYILKRFSELFKSNNMLEEICNKIYWQANGVEFSDNPETRKLLRNHLIKIHSITNRLVPYHDIYTKYFRKKYPYKVVISEEKSPIASFQYNDFSRTKEVIDELKILLKKQEYNIIYYTLDPIFQGGKSAQYKNYFNLNDYYQLFLFYAEACTHSSMEYSTKDIYKKIYSETKNVKHQSTIIIQICNKALWELTNSSFEWLEYDQAQIYLNDLKKQINELIKYKILKGKPQNSVRYHNAEVIRCLIASEIEDDDIEEIYEEISSSMLENKFYNRRLSFEIRYCLTIMQRSPEKAMEKLNYCNQYLQNQTNPNDKYFLWSGFYSAYLDMIINDNYHSSLIALDFMQKLHDKYFNDYRKCMYGMATYFYYRKKIEKGDALLFSDTFVMREKRPRLKGFYFLAIALHDVVTYKYINALVSLEKAQEIFNNIPSYNKLIAHNINLLKISSSSPIQIEYYTNGELKEDIYYLDLRCCW
jgi:hypothetical protein